MTPEREALDRIADHLAGLLGRGMSAQGVDAELTKLQSDVDLIAAVLPPAPPDPDACNWCQDGKHDRCQGYCSNPLPGLEGDGPGQASGACLCRTPHPRRN